MIITGHYGKGCRRLFSAREIPPHRSSKLRAVLCVTAIRYWRPGWTLRPPVGCSSWIGALNTTLWGERS